MLPSRSPSSTSPAPALAGLAALAAAAALGLAGCGDDCGPGGAPSTGLLASGSMVTLEYGDLRAGLNNDCPAAGAPEGVISLTIEGLQTGDPLGLITFCIPRPDQLMEGDRALGAEFSTADVHVVDVKGNANSCAFDLDASKPPTGTVEATGVCASGDSPEGFALAFDGGVTLRRTCGATIDAVDVTLRGRIGVAHR